MGLYKSVDVSVYKHSPQGQSQKLAKEKLQRTEKLRKSDLIQYGDVQGSYRSTQVHEIKYTMMKQKRKSLADEHIKNKDFLPPVGKYDSIKSFKSLSRLPANSITARRR